KTEVRDGIGLFRIRARLPNGPAGPSTCVPYSGMCYHAPARIPVSGHQDRDDGHLHTRRLHASVLIRVSDTLCTAERNLAWGTTEVARATQVVLVRRGVFAYRTPRGASLADATSAMLLNAGGAQEVRPPLAGRHDRPAIRLGQ